MNQFPRIINFFDDLRFDTGYTVFFTSFSSYALCMILEDNSRNIITDEPDIGIFCNQSD